MKNILEKFNSLRSFTKTSFYLRLFGFVSLFGYVLIRSIFLGGEESPIFFVSLVVCLLWPWIALLFALYMKKSHEAEVYNTLIDPLVAGFMVGLIHAPIFLVLSCFGVTGVGTLSTYGWKQFFWQVPTFLGSITLGLLFVDFKIMLFPEAIGAYIIVSLSVVVFVLFWVVGANRIKIAKRLALELEHEKKSLNEISTILASIGSTFDLNTLMDSFIAAIQDEISFDGAILFIHDIEKNRLRQRFIFSKYKSKEELMQTKPIKLDLESEHGLLLKLFDANEISYQQEINPSLIKNPADIAFYSIQPFSSLLGIPIIASDNKIGLIVFSFRQARNAMPRENLDKLSHYISHITFVINNDILYNKSLSVSKNLQATNQSLEKIFNRVKKYLSPQIISAIFSNSNFQENRIKKRWLTVYCSDIENFTKISESLSPEELQKLLNSYLNAMTDVVIEYGGTIDKYIGDMITVFFGDPETLGPKEDALRCVKMSLALNARLEKLREQWLEEGLVQTFKTRSAITSGILLVGNIGGHTRQDYTVYGTAINSAMALQSKAESGGILLSESTYSLIKNEFACASNESMDKVMEESTKYYRLVGKLNDTVMESFHLSKATEHFALDLVLPQITATDLHFAKNNLSTLRKFMINKTSFFKKIFLKFKNFNLKNIF